VPSKLSLRESTEPLIYSHNLLLGMIHLKNQNSRRGEVGVSQQHHLNRVAQSTNSNRMSKGGTVLGMRVPPLKLSKEEGSYLGYLVKSDL